MTQLTSQAKRRARLQAQGLCSICLKHPTEFGYATCHECRAKIKAKAGTTIKIDTALVHKAWERLGHKGSMAEAVMVYLRKGLEQ